MRIVDLTHMIYPEMPVFPGTEPPILQTANTVEKDGFLEAKITMYSHTGTHMDAPAHMLKDGLTLDKLPIEQFIGKAMVLDFEDRGESFIELKDMKIYEDKIKKVDFIILKTGWSEYWGQSKYFEGFPSLTAEAAEWLSNFPLKGVGIDAISIDDMNSSSFEVHKILMEKNMLIIENLTNLEQIKEEYFMLSILPLKNIHADGSPLRAVAMENI